MNTMKPLPKTQAAALEILRTAGELERTDWNLAGANTNAIDALAVKGLVTRETRDFLDLRFFSGPTVHAGSFYRVA
jgi:hypothetical protein